MPNLLYLSSLSSSYFIFSGLHSKYWNLLSYFSNWLINQKSLCFSSVYLLVYNWSWYVSIWAGIDYFTLNRDFYPNLFFVKSPYYSLFFYPKKWFHFFFAKRSKLPYYGVHIFTDDLIFFCINHNLWSFSPFWPFFWS